MPKERAFVDNETVLLVPSFFLDGKTASQGFATWRAVVLGCMVPGVCSRALVARVQGAGVKNTLASIRFVD